MCDLADKPIDTVSIYGFDMKDRNGNKRRVHYKLNYTQSRLFRFGKQRYEWIFKTFFDEAKVNAESCMDDDCLHPCYNTEYTMHCPRCWFAMEKALVGGKQSPEEKAKLVEMCGKCEVPPADDPDLPAPYKEYVPKQYPAAMTFEEWKADKLKKKNAAKKEEEEIANGTTKLTPQQIEARNKAIALLDEKCPDLAEQGHLITKQWPF